MYKLFSAVNHMHENDIWHRDIKMENILFSSKKNCYKDQVLQQKIPKKTMGQIHLEGQFKNQITTHLHTKSNKIMEILALKFQSKKTILKILELSKRRSRRIFNAVLYQLKIPEKQHRLFIDSNYNRKFEKMSRYVLQRDQIVTWHISQKISKKSEMKSNKKKSKR